MTSACLDIEWCKLSAEVLRFAQDDSIDLWGEFVGQYL
jgi:hypothetical protein